MTARRIAILGAESTGKSWLALALAQRLQAHGLAARWVPEQLRIWCEREGRTPTAHEQWAIAQAQVHAVLAESSAVVIADTTALMTAVYSQYVFGDGSLFPFALTHQRLYSHTLVTATDIAWVADGIQRDGPQVREPVDRLLRQSLLQAGIAFSVVHGHGQQRLDNALMALGWPDYAQHAAGRIAPHENRPQWTCEKCSDPDCEHRLFTGLLKCRQNPQPGRA
jgi:nicotinamide riboside kinase